jgi:hypothetical protein
VAVCQSKDRIVAALTYGSHAAGTADESLTWTWATELEGLVTERLRSI